GEFGLRDLFLVAPEANAGREREPLRNLPRGVREEPIGRRILRQDGVARAKNARIAVAERKLRRIRARPAALEGPVRRSRILLKIRDAGDELDPAVRETERELQLLIRDVGLDVRGPHLGAELYPVGDAVAREIREAGDRAQRQVVVELP